MALSWKGSSLSWKASFGIAALFLFFVVSFIAAPVVASSSDTPPYSGIITSQPTNGYCVYNTSGYWWECVNGSTSNGGIIILANASADSGLSFASSAYILFQGPSDTTSGGYLTVGEELAFDGAVQAGNTGTGGGDGDFYSYLAYQWVYCGVLPCATNTVTHTVLIWDAIVDGSGVITSSGCGSSGCSYSWYTSVHSSWLNTYYTGAASYVSASAYSSCPITCGTAYGRADFSNHGYSNTVNKISVSP